MKGCQFCNSNAIEDEFHFLTQCSLYDDLRITLYDKSSRILENFVDYNDNEIFIHLCQTAQKYVSQFIENSYQKRRLIMYHHV